MSVRPARLSDSGDPDDRLWRRLFATIFAAVAQEPAYPDRPITMVVTFAAGGSSDLLARAAADAMAHGLGQQVAVDNRPGAGGHIGAEAVAHAASDGYTVLFGTNGTLGIGPTLYRNLRYDPARDLVPVGLLHKLPLLLVVNPSIAGDRSDWTDRICPQQAGSAFNHFRRRRIGIASCRRIAETGGGRRYLARALQGRRRGGAGLAVGSRLDDARDDPECVAAGPQPADARDRGDVETAIGFGARGIPTLDKSGLPRVSMSAHGPDYSSPPERHAAIVARLNSETRRMAGEQKTMWRSSSRWEPMSKVQARRNSANSCATTLRAGLQIIKRSGIPPIE